MATNHPQADCPERLAEMLVTELKRIRDELLELLEEEK